MRVLDNIAGRAVRAVDQTAERWLVRAMGEVGEDSLSEALRAGDVALLRRIMLLTGAALPLAPLALTAVMGPVLALPVGVAAVVSVSLIAVAAAFARPRPLPHSSALSPTFSDDLAFDVSPGLMLALDVQGRVVRTGGRDRQIFPSSLRECVREMLVERVHVSDQIVLLQALDSLRQGASKACVDVRVQKALSPADGRQFMPVRLDFTAIRNAEGDLVQILAQALDFSELDGLRKEAERRIEDARSAHETKSRFLAAVSHELRTPLNAILGFSDVLAGEYFGRLENDRQREYVGLIRQSGGHLLSVVNAMLDMSKIEAGRYELLVEPFGAADAVETCRAMLDLQARDKGVTLTARASRGMREVIADRRALQQILINLAGNAIKFTDRGGVVSMDAVIRGGDLVITVSDTGIGIAAEKLGTLGQPFTQVENDHARHYEGTGLGLALVKGLISLHRGTFAIASRPGEGTVVTVTLPADGPDAAVDDGVAVIETAEFPPRLNVARAKTMNESQVALGLAAGMSQIGATTAGMIEAGLKQDLNDDHAEAKSA